jgi:hypothetical protein
VQGEGDDYGHPKKVIVMAKLSGEPAAQPDIPCPDGPPDR